MTSELGGYVNEEKDGEITGILNDLRCRTSFYKSHFYPLDGDVALFPNIYDDEGAGLRTGICICRNTPNAPQLSHRTEED